MELTFTYIGIGFIVYAVITFITMIFKYFSHGDAFYSYKDAEIKFLKDKITSLEKQILKHQEEENEALQTIFKKIGRGNNG